MIGFDTLKARSAPGSSIDFVLCGRMWATGFASLLLALGASAVSAQPQEEGVPTVVDEVIAQVNDDVVMLSGLKREMSQATETLKQRGTTERQAAEKAAKDQPQIIVNLITEKLILQKGKDIPRLSEDVEAEIEREMLRIARQQGIKAVAELDMALRRDGFNPAEIRQTLRTRYMQQAVLSREVDAKIYHGLRDTELRMYFEANREKFRKLRLTKRESGRS